MLKHFLDPNLLTRLGGQLKTLYTVSLSIATFMYYLFVNSSSILAIVHHILLIKDFKSKLICDLEWILFNINFPAIFRLGRH